MQFVELPVKIVAILSDLTNHIILHALEPLLDEVLELVDLALFLGLLVGLFFWIRQLRKLKSYQDRENG